MEAKLHRMRGELLKPAPDSIVAALKRRELDSLQPAAAGVNEELMQLEYSLDPAQFDVVAQEMPGYARRLQGPLSGRSEASHFSIESGLSSNGSIGSSKGAQSVQSSFPRAVADQASEGPDDSESFAQLVVRHQQRRAQVLGRLAGAVGASVQDVQSVREKRKLTGDDLEDAQHLRSPFTFQRVAAARFVDSCQQEIRRMERTYRKLVKTRKPSKPLPPEAPYSVKCIGSMAEAVYFKWQPPVFDGGANVFDYELKYVRRRRVKVTANTSRWEQENVGPESTTQWLQQFPVAHFGIAISGLSAQTQLEGMQVRAVNAAGRSEWSDPFPIAKTGKPHVPGAPIHLRIAHLEPELIRFEWAAPLVTGGRTLLKGELRLSVEVPDFMAITASGDASATRTEIETYTMPRWQTYLEVRNLQPGSMVHDVSVVGIDNAGERTIPSEPIEYVEIPQGTLVQRLRWEIAHYQNMTDGVIDVIRHGVHQRTKRTKHLRVLRSELKRELQKLGLSTSSMSSIGGDSGNGLNGQPGGQGTRVLSQTELDRRQLAGLTRGDGLTEDQQKEQDFKRKQYHKKIDQLVAKRKAAETAVEAMKAERVRQQVTLQQAHNKVSIIRAEIAAIAGFKGKFVDSMALHGRMQRFEITELRRKLDEESARNEALLADMKLDIVDGMREQEVLEEQASQLSDRVKEREAALLRFEQDCRRASRKAKMLARMGNASAAKSFDRWKAFVRDSLQQKHLMKKVMLRMLKVYVAGGFLRWASQTKLHREAEEQYNQRAGKSRPRRKSSGGSSIDGPSKGPHDEGASASHFQDPMQASKAARQLAKDLGLPLSAVLGAKNGDPGSGKAGDPLLQALVVHRQADRVRGAGGQLLERAEIHRSKLMAEAGSLIRAVRKLDATVDISELTGDQLLELGTKRGADYSTAAARLIKFKSKLALLGTKRSSGLKVLLGEKEEEMSGAGYACDAASSDDDEDGEDRGNASADEADAPLRRGKEAKRDTDIGKDGKVAEVAARWEPVSGPFGSAHQIRHQQDKLKQHGMRGMIGEPMESPSKPRGAAAAQIVSDALVRGRRRFEMDGKSGTRGMSRRRPGGMVSAEPEVQLLRGETGLLAASQKGQFVSNESRAKANEIALTIQTLVRQSERYIMDGRLDEAHTILRRIEFIAGRCKDSGTLLRIYAALSKMYMGMNRFEIAALHYQRFNELALETGNEWLQADALEGRSIALQKIGSLEDALRAMAEATELRGQLGDSRGRVRCLRLQAKVLHSIGSTGNASRAEQLDKQAEEEENQQKKMLGAGIKELSRLQARLIGVGLSDARLIELEPVGPMVTYLRNEASAIEKELAVVIRLVETTTSFVQKTRRRLQRSISLIESTRASGDEMIQVSGSASDSGPQFVRREQLVMELEGGINGMRSDADEADTLRKRYLTRQSNCYDELAEIKRRMRVELTVLARKINLKNHFRCVALNSVNLRHNDALGRSSQSVPRVATSNEKAVMVYELESGQAQSAFQGDTSGSRIGPPIGHTKRITSMAFYESRVYTGSMDGTIRVWDTKRRLAASTSRQRQVDEMYGGTSAPAGVVRHQKQQAMGAPPSGGGPTDLESFAKLSKDDKDAAMYRYKKKKILRSKASSMLDDVDPDFDIPEMGASSTSEERERACVMTLRGHTGTVWSIAANSTVIVSGSADCSIRLWRANDGRMLRRVRGHSGTVRCIGLGQHAFATGGADHEVRVWTYAGPKASPCQQFQQAAILVGHECIVTSIAMEGFECISGGADGRILVWDIPGGTKARDFEVHKGTVTTLQFDATKVVSGGNDLAIRITDLITGAQLQIISEAHKLPILDLQYDTKQLVTVAGDHTLRVWAWSDTQGATSARMHIVAGGQTPQDIAKLYGVTVQGIMRWNKLATANELYIGRRIMVAPAATADENDGGDGDGEHLSDASLDHPEGPQSKRPVDGDGDGDGDGDDDDDDGDDDDDVDFSGGYKIFKKQVFSGKVGDVLAGRRTLRQMQRDLKHRKWGKRSQPLTSVEGYVSFTMLKEMVEASDVRGELADRGLAELEDKALLNKSRRMAAVAADSKERLQMDMEFGNGQSVNGYGHAAHIDESAYDNQGLDPEMGVTVGGGAQAAARQHQQDARLRHEQHRRTAHAAAAATAAGSPARSPASEQYHGTAALFQPRSPASPADERSSLGSRSMGGLDTSGFDSIPAHFTHVHELDETKESVPDLAQHPGALPPAVGTIDISGGEIPSEFTDSLQLQKPREEGGSGGAETGADGQGAGLSDSEDEEDCAQEQHRMVDLAE